MINQAPNYEIVWKHLDFNLDLSTISNYHDFLRASIDTLSKNAVFQRIHQKSKPLVVYFCSFFLSFGLIAQ